MTQTISGDILPEGWINPFNDRRILRYFTSVSDWHGYIRFLGLTAIWDTPDLPIERLFVAPRLSERLIEPKADNDTLRDTFELHAYLKEHPRLVVLGDPGCGKSTLVSWLAYRLTFHDNGGLSDAIGRLVPFPMVLRELDLSEVKDWDTLWHAFMQHPVAEPLKDVDCEALLRSGQALVMLDGYDEIMPLRLRRRLRRAIQAGMIRYGRCRWLLTSRILGYREAHFRVLGAPGLREAGDEVGDELPLEPDEPTTELATMEADDDEGRVIQRPARSSGCIWDRRLIINRGSQTERELERIGEHLEALVRSHVEGLLSVGEVFIAPFNDDQVARFATNWYAIRDSRAKADDRNAADFIKAVRGAPDTMELARVPNLLTMMVLVHRNRTVLPHGKAYLYEEITKAYLGGIDAFRKLDALEEYTYSEKRSWLARVGYDMQKRRTRDDASVLASRDEVQGWLEAAARPRHGDAAPDIAKRFLDYVARRSGLLLPRTETHFAFVHLSFMEYFAGAYLHAHVTKPSWFRGTATDPSRADLHEWAGHEEWAEPILFLFQLLREEDEWDETLLDTLFGDVRERDNGDAVLGTAVRVATNPYSPLAEEQRRKVFQQAWWWESVQYGADQDAGDLSRVMVQSAEVDLALGALIEVMRTEPRSAVVLRSASAQACARVASLPGIRSLCLRGCLIRDARFLEAASALTDLALTSCAVTDLSPLSGMAGLRSLNVTGTSVSDLSPLGGLAQLHTLFADSTWVSDLSPLAGLTALQRLSFDSTDITDLSPLAALEGITYLSVDGTQVRDLSPLAHLTALQRVGLIGTQVSDVSPLAGAADMLSLWLTNTPVSQLAPVRALSGLIELALAATPCSDLSPLSGLARLRWLWLAGTPVTDLSPLAGLHGLRILDITDTPVTDVSCLDHLTELEIVGGPKPRKRNRPASS